MGGALRVRVGVGVCTCMCVWLNSRYRLAAYYAQQAERAALLLALQTKSAVKIQTRWRGVLARRATAVIAAQQRGEAVVVTLQVGSDGHVRRAVPTDARVDGSTNVCALATGRQAGGWMLVGRGSGVVAPLSAAPRCATLLRLDRDRCF